MYVLVGLLVCCLFHARSAHLNKRFNQREEKQRALCSRVLPALNTFAAIGHEQSVVVMAVFVTSTKKNVRSYDNRTLRGTQNRMFPYVYSYVRLLKNVRLSRTFIKPYVFL